MCTTLEYTGELSPFFKEENFLPYALMDCWVPLHRGACVYECYAKATGQKWGDVCRIVAAVEEKDLRSGMYSFTYRF